MGGVGRCRQAVTEASIQLGPLDGKPGLPEVSDAQEFFPAISPERVGRAIQCPAATSCPSERKLHRLTKKEGGVCGLITSEVSDGDSGAEAGDCQMKGGSILLLEITHKKKKVHVRGSPAT